jgi:hypothetical protein
MEREDDRVPVTSLTGFLGAGKTTLLEHLIRDPQTGRITAVMNEFGDVGLDHDLIEEVIEKIVLLQSGCLCCSIRGDLAKTMLSLIARRKRGELIFDRVVLETKFLPFQSARPFCCEAYFGRHSQRPAYCTVPLRSRAQLRRASCWC